MVSNRFVSHYDGYVWTNILVFVQWQQRIGEYVGMCIQ